MINSKYLKKCQEKKQFMAFTILIILSGVENKFNKNFNTENYVILKNRTVSIYLLVQKENVLISTNIIGTW
jgi:hypothetical protein